MRLLFPIRESNGFAFRAEFFNPFNHANFANPISNLNALVAPGGRIDPTKMSTLGEIAKSFRIHTYNKHWG